MMIALHKNARTTPAIRAEIAASADSIVALARRYGISEQTVSKWKKRSSVHDASHTPHRLQTTLTPAQERIVVELRRTLLLPLDDLLAVTREFICPKATRSGLDRCLRRHGVDNLNALQPAPPTSASKPFKAYEPGYLHIDLKYLPQMQDESSRRYLFVAIDRATRWVFVQVKKNKTAASAKAFLSAVHKACPMRIQKVLTDNGKEFTDRLFATRAKQPSGEHEFDQLCASLGIEHRLTKPRTPRTNGMVERFNGRIADVLRSHRFQTGEDLEQTLLRYVALYNHQFPQSALKSRTPIQAMKDWYAERVDLFVRRPCNQTGLDNLVLDSFAGSGTTGAVAHKMGRRWIMVELGEHCHTHVIPRLKAVVNGEDQGGISKAVEWQGGGGFRYYKLAPTLIVSDRWGNPVINPEYNAAQLAEALAKLEGFTYAPSEVQWWQHGHSSERDFIYITTQNLSAEQLQALSDEVGSDQSLLVCCAAFHGVTAARASERWPNLTLKKIPKMVLARCEWGHDDYSLNVANLPMAEPEGALSPALSREGRGRKARETAATPDLFGDGGEAAE
jgi:transposase InsO family protein